MLPLVALISAIDTCESDVGVIAIVSIDVRHVYILSTKLVVAVKVLAAFVIWPVTVVVYTPYSVGIDQDITRVAVLNVINYVL